MESKVAKCDCVLEVHDARVCVTFLPTDSYNVLILTLPEY